ncbi:MAG: hypothetical protein J6N54_06840 [Bacteroidales bacterium]|nr:hypothetical protein [Bacteroidales bacterium]
MKTIDEIEKLTMEDLERISLDESVEVPAGLEERILSAVHEKRVSPSRFLWLAGVAASVALVIAIGVNHRPDTLKDTFDDPALAYAEVEKALISFTEIVNNQINNISK